MNTVGAGHITVTWLLFIRMDPLFNDVVSTSDCIGLNRMTKVNIFAAATT